MTPDRLTELRSKVHHGYNLLASEAREVFSHYGEPIEEGRKRCDVCGGGGFTCRACDGTGYKSLTDERRNRCERCGGSGWMWWNELKSHAGHDPTSLVVDDTQYTCDECDGTGYVQSVESV